MPGLHHIPSRRLVNNFTEKLYDALLPIICQPELHTLETDVISVMKDELQAFVGQVMEGDENAIDFTEQLFEKLPEICADLCKDANLILKYDAAAYSLEEVIMTYPGFMAIAIYRLSHELYLMKVPILPRMMSEWAHVCTGIDINPGATIGHPFFIDHGTGVVIGETAVIGNNVKLYQGVTLGATHVAKLDAKGRRHPTVEDNVIVYANSTILGGATVIGHDSVIGPNTWIIGSIPPNSLVHQQAQVIMDRKDAEKGIEWVR